ncbi:MAG TPA: hypothetical protein VF590_16555 [Isosphaeraceae bacterium]|jgi:hypothetical protein
MPTDSKTKPAAGVAGAADPTAALASFWTQWLEQSTRGTQAMMEAMNSVSDPQQAQRQWLDAVSRGIEDFMRTPVFLEAMKRNMKALTDMKTMQDQVLQGAARQLGMPLADDIAGLFERLKSTEQTIINRLKAIEDRLKAIEAKLGG